MRNPALNEHNINTTIAPNNPMTMNSNTNNTTGCGAPAGGSNHDSNPADWIISGNTLTGNNTYSEASTTHSEWDSYSDSDSACASTSSSTSSGFGCEDMSAAYEALTGRKISPPTPESEGVGTKGFAKPSKMETRAVAQREFAAEPGCQDEDSELEQVVTLPVIARPMPMQRTVALCSHGLL